LLLRGFYALEDTKTPFYINIVLNLINLVVAIYMFNNLAENNKVTGLVIGYVSSYVLVTPLLWYFLNRKGLNLGEGAAYLVLESEASMKETKTEAIAYLAGYANTNDAHHQTASSENGDGAFLAMEAALKMAKLNPQEIDYINVHGTATPNNDLSEGRAMLRVFGNQVPTFSSTKAFTGHTLAAAASIEAVFSLLALENQHVYANLNFKTPIDDLNLVPVLENKSITINNILSNSFGFGGNCSTLIFSKHPKNG
jgi:3-oxoacyl-[acyl-carrier-protein] synthase-1